MSSERQSRSMPIHANTLQLQTLSLSKRPVVAPASSLINEQLNPQDESLDLTKFFSGRSPSFEEEDDDETTATASSDGEIFDIEIMGINAFSSAEIKSATR